MNYELTLSRRNEKNPVLPGFIFQPSGCLLTYSIAKIVSDNTIAIAINIPTELVARANSAINITITIDKSPLSSFIQIIAAITNDLKNAIPPVN